MKKKRLIIEEVVSDLKTGKEKNFSSYNYALDENIKFFSSLKNMPSFIAWLIFRMPKLEGDKLLELSDFHLSKGKWETILQKELKELESNKFFDILKPLRQEIIDFVESNENKEENLLIINIGSGSMEIERQLIRELEDKGSQQKIVFLGVDSSEASISFARENLKADGIELKQINIQDNEIEKLKEKKEIRTIAVCKAEALTLENTGIKPDLIFHSKLKHHIPKDQWERFDNLLLKICPMVIEFDNYKSFFIIMFSAIINWNKPILNNGAIFSCLRSTEKRALKRDYLTDWKTKIQLGTYLKYRNGNNK
jgi:hypothetical protein